MRNPLEKLLDLQTERMVHVEPVRYQINYRPIEDPQRESIEIAIARDQGKPGATVSLSSLHPGIRGAAEYLVQELTRLGVRCRITSTYRDPREQQILYDRRRRTLEGRLQRGERPQLYPVARPGESRHEYGGAWDMIVEPANLQTVVGQIWKSWGGFWTASDPIHFGDIG